MNRIVLGVLLTNRLKEAPAFQELITQYEGGRSLAGGKTKIAIESLV